MKGRIVKAAYVWKKDPETKLIGYFAVNCEEFLDHFDDMIVYYLDDETELNEVMTYQGKNGFMIIAIL